MPTLIKRIMTAVTKHPLSRWVWSDDWLCVMRVGPESLASLPDAPEVAMDSWAHLELFEQTESWLTKEQFLALARRRLSRGLHVFSIADQGVLACYLWLEPQRSKATYAEVDLELPLPEKSCTSFHGYTHPAARGKKYYTKCKAACIRWAFQVNGSQHLFTGVNPANLASLKAAHNTGYSEYARLHRRTRFGKCVRTIHLSADARALGITA